MVIETAFMLKSLEVMEGNISAWLGGTDRQHTDIQADNVKYRLNSLAFQAGTAKNVSLS